MGSETGRLSTAPRAVGWAQRYSELLDCDAVLRALVHSAGATGMRNARACRKGTTIGVARSRAVPSPVSFPSTIRAQLLAPPLSCRQRRHGGPARPAGPGAGPGPESEEGRAMGGLDRRLRVSSGSSAACGGSAHPRSLPQHRATLPLHSTVPVIMPAAAAAATPPASFRTPPSPHTRLPDHGDAHRGARGGGLPGHAVRLLHRQLAGRAPPPAQLD